MTDLGVLVRALNELYRLSGSAKVHADTVRRTGVQVSQTGLRTLSLVEDTPRISATEVASTLDVSQPTASRTLQQLEVDGLVTRHASDTDGRVSHYVVSARGRRALAKVHEYHEERLRFALEGLDGARRSELSGAVTELVNRLTAAAQPRNRRTA
ncbi:MAG TPA: MarR family winged helix-turn-helix transcriptional regulator [Mycobacteriales bacterium]|nr:MarR family winged helix-turn-helix transcriptional regulator [Mycobacteriales bacterium]